MSLVRTTSGGFAARFYYYDADGKRQRLYRVLDATSKRDAQIEYDLLKANAHALAEHKAEPEAFTISKAVVTYLRLKGNVLSESVKYSVGYYLKHWLRLLGDKDYRELKKVDIQDYVIARTAEVSARTKKAPSKAGILREAALLKSCYSCAVEFELIPFNPLASFKIDRATLSKRTDVFEKPELVKFFDSFSKADQHYLPYFRCLYMTGSLVSEILTLNFTGINFVRNEVTIYQHKTKNFKTLPLSPELREVLETAYKNAKDRSGLVFPNQQKSAKAIRKEVIGRVFKRTLKASEIKKPLVPHSLRHSFATHVLADGLSMYLVSRCLGHTDINTTLAQYAHVQNASLAGVMNHIGQSANQPEAAKTGQLSSKDPA